MSDPDPAPSSPLLAAARSWFDAGFAVIPSHEDGGKRPFGRWKEYAVTRPTWAEVEGWLSTGRYSGIGVICGQVSGGVEMVEIEGPAEAAVERLGRVMAAADRYGSRDLMGVVARGCVEQSAGGGLHMFVRIGDGPAKPNTKLAMAGTGPNRHVIAETRGEGGFVIVAPTPARKGHAAGTSYLFLQGSAPAGVPTITAEQRDELHLLLTMALDEDEPSQSSPTSSPVSASAGTGTVDPSSPFGEFRARTTWRDILAPAGWREGPTEADGHTHWTRPGGTGFEGTSATTLEDGPMYVFSTSTDLPAERGLTKEYVHAHLNHGGDLAAASRALRDAGYGSAPVAPLQPWELPPGAIPPEVADMTPEEREAELRSLWVREHLPRLDWSVLWADETEEEWIVEPLLAARRLVALYSAPKVGKALDIATPIPTPRGFVRMGDLVAGDLVFDEHGDPCRVLVAGDVQHGRPCYRVTFSDDTSIVADAEHEWEVRRRNSARPMVVTTEHMYREGVVEDPATNRKRWAIDGVPRLETDDVDLPIDPYVLGYWLGDGCSYNAEIVTADEGVVEEIESRGYEARSKPSSKHGEATSYWITADASVKPVTLLRSLGLLKPAGGRKHIPQIYMWAGTKQRLDLLRGLMDSDGYAPTAKGTGRPPCELTLTDERLSRDCLVLIRSLGYKAVVAESDAKIDGRVVGRRWRITFHASGEESPFYLYRKSARLMAATTDKRARSDSRQIVSIEPVDSRPVRCIQVDSARHLYLAGDGMVPTHNSLLMLEIGAAVACGRGMFGYPATGGPRRTLYVDFENDPRGDTRARLVDMGYGPGDLDNLVMLSFPTLAALDTDDGGRQLLAAVAEYRCEVVVIDTVSRSVAGDENENDTWLKFYRATGLRLKQAGIALIRLDHSGKDATKGQRGGSAKSGDVDAIWQLRKVDEDVLELECDGARFPVPERLVTLRRCENPLRHEVDGLAWMQVRDEMVERLARARVPRDPRPTIRVASEALKAAGITFTKSALTRGVIDRYCETPASWDALQMGGS